MGRACDGRHAEGDHASHRFLECGLIFIMYRKGIEEEGAMLSQDYLFVALFVITAWLLLHISSGDSMRH